MPEQNEWVVAFAGSGDTTLENATALLNNWITDDTGIKDFYVPAKINKRNEKGLANVVSYLTTEWAEFQTADVGEFIEILSTARAGGHEPYLVVIVGDETPDDVTADLVEAALEANIPVKDLAAGLDDITETGDDGAEQAAPEPERPAAGTTRRRRTSSTPERAKPAEAVSEPSSNDGPRPRRRGTPRNVTINETGIPLAEDTSGTPPWKEDDPGTAVARATKAAVDAAALLPGPDVRTEIRTAMADAFYAAAQALSGQAVASAPSGPTTAYIKDTLGKLRKRGRGKPRTGEEVVFLTDTEVTAAVEKGLLEQ